MGEYLKLAAIDGFPSRNGWIDKKGRFFPCPFTGHNDLLDRIKEQGLPQDEFDNLEHDWIKVSCGIFIGMTVFITMGNLLTGKQKLAIQNYIKVYPEAMKDGEFIHVGKYTLYTEDGKLKWEKTLD